MQQAINWKGGLTAIALTFTPFVACSTYVKINPDGFPAGGPATYEGLIVVGDRGWDYAAIETIGLLKLNERERLRGMQTVETVCVLSGQKQPQLVQALTKAPPNKSGYRAIWVKMIAKPRHSTSACSNFYAHRSSKTVWGEHIRIVSVMSAEPVLCDYTTFIRNRRRCPNDQASSGSSKEYGWTEERLLVDRR